jgi:hypothetical protein
MIRTIRNSRLSNFIIALLVLISFGPYVFKSLSLQLIDLGLICFFLISFYKVMIKKKETKFSYDLLLYSFILLILFLSSLINFNQLLLSAFIASCSRFLQFLFVYVICMNFNSFNIIHVYKYFLFALTFNSIVIVLQFQESPVFEIFKNHWFTDYSVSIASRAQQMGRISGVIKQPLESGLCYSFGLFALVYAYLKTKKSSYFMFLPIVLFGGIVSVSKIFIFLGIPLSILLYIFNSKLSKNIIFLFFSFFLFTVIALFVENWEAGPYLLRLFDSSNLEGGVGFLTSSRFGGDNKDVEELFTTVLTNAPVLGFGMGSTQLLDNGFIEFLYQGGIVALLLYILLHLIYFFKIGRLEGKLDKSFMMIFIVFIIFSSIGAPVFTYSRFSTFLVCTFFYFTNSNSQRNKYI